MSAVLAGGVRPARLAIRTGPLRGGRKGCRIHQTCFGPQGETLDQPERKPHPLAPTLHGTDTRIPEPSLALENRIGVNQEAPRFCRVAAQQTYRTSRGACILSAWFAADLLISRGAEAVGPGWATGTLQPERGCSRLLDPDTARDTLEAQRSIEIVKGFCRWF